MNKAQKIQALEALSKGEPLPKFERVVKTAAKAEAEAPAEVAEEKPVKQRKANGWSAWCKDYAKKHGVKYGDAMKLGDLYRKEKVGKAEPKAEAKEEEPVVEEVEE